MTRRLARAMWLAVLYAGIGTVATLIVYRLLFGQPLASAGTVERSMDAFVVFLGVAFNTILAFAASGLIAAVMAHFRSPLGAVVAVSAMAAGLIGLMMLLWFPGLTILYPLLMAGAGALAAIVANGFDMLWPDTPGDLP